MHIESKPSPRPGVPVLHKERRFRVRVPGPDGTTPEIDLTQALTEAVAHELWKRFGGNSVVNWLQAEAVVDAISRTYDATPTADNSAAEQRPAEPRAAA